MEKALQNKMLYFDQTSSRPQHKRFFVFVHTYPFQKEKNPKKGGR
jgi:hypothetical protein